MHHHNRLTKQQLHKLIQNKQITLAGWSKGKIYGLLSCASGRHKIHRDNRVFFKDEAQAQQAGYRPCFYCMRQAYNDWKAQQKDPVR